jgi:cell division septation protein DedD
MLRRGVLAVVIAAALFGASVGTGFLFANEALRHSAGAGLTAALSVPRPAGQLSGPIVPPSPPAAATSGPDAHSAGLAGNASGAPPLASPAATSAPSPSGAATGTRAGTPSGGVPVPEIRTPGPAAPTGLTGPGAAPPPAPVAPAVSPPAAPVSPGITATTPPDTTLPPGATPLVPAPPVSTPGAVLPGRYHVQVGSFDERQNADALAIRLRAGGYAATVTDGPPYRVWVGGYLDQVTATRLAAGLRDLGLTPELVTQ